MKILNENTRKVLSQLTNINTIGIIDYPTMNIRSEADHVIAFFSTEALGEPQFEKFGVFSISELLQVTNLVENPEIDLEDSIISIKSGNTAIKYITTDVGILGEYTRIKHTLLTSTRTSPDVQCALEFDLDASTLHQIKKASDVFKLLDSFKIEGSNKDSTINLSIGDSAKNVKNSNAYAINLSGVVKKDMEVKIPVKSIKVIPNGSYKVQVMFNTKNSKSRIIMSSQDIPTLEFLLATI